MTNTKKYPTWSEEYDRVEDLKRRYKKILLTDNVEKVGFGIYMAENNMVKDINELNYYYEKPWKWINEFVEYKEKQKVEDERYAKLKGGDKKWNS